MKSDVIVEKNVKRISTFKNNYATYNGMVIGYI